MSDNVQVCCRFRPINHNEESMGSPIAISVLDTKTVRLDVSSSADGDERRRATVSGTNFNFDYVFGPNASQEEVFAHSALPLADEVMRGFNCTIFAYGQTGSGKTFTMMGVPGDRRQAGIIPRLATALFDHIEQSDEQIEFTVKLSYVEIYNERINDLLDPSQNNLKIREGARGVWIQDVTERYVSSIEEIIDMVNLGAEARATAATNMNEYSSRSHSVFMMTIGQRNKMSGSKTGSKLILVDLAGSEAVSKSGAAGSTLKEAQHINRSLSALGNVINALTSGSPHIPYRDSKLTRLLSDSLGGNSKTCLIVTASPVSYNIEETLSTLRFGTRAKKIRNKPTINQEKSAAEYKMLLAAAVAKCAEQEEVIQKLKRVIARLKEVLLKNGLAIPAMIEEEERQAQMPAKSGDLGDEKAGGDPMEMRARAEDAVLHNLELQGNLERLEMDTREKEEAVQRLTEELGEKDKQLEQLSSEMSDKEREIQTLQQQLADAMGRNGGTSSAEYEGMKRKVDLLEREQGVYQGQIQQLQADNKELAQLQQMMASNNMNMNKRSSASKAGKVPDKNATGADEDSDSDDQLEAGSTASFGSSMDEQVRQLKTNYDVLMAALGRKCEQYIALQMQMQKQNDKISELERRVSESQTVVDNRSDEKLKELTKRLEASNALCQKLYTSGLYWQKRGQRKDKELKDTREQMDKLLSRLGERPPPMMRNTSIIPAHAAENMEELDPTHVLQGDGQNGGRAAGRAVNFDVSPRAESGAPSSNLTRARTQSSARLVVPQLIHGGGGARSVLRPAGPNAGNAPAIAGGQRKVEVNRAQTMSSVKHNDDMEDAFF